MRPFILHMITKLKGFFGKVGLLWLKMSRDVRRKIIPTVGVTPAADNQDFCMCL
jgi:hypothetical protein